MIAASVTVLASGPNADIPNQCSLRPPGRGTSPGAGFNPNRPQQAAGILIEPPPSEPSARAAIPAATAAARPQVEPPGVRLRSHGLRVAAADAGSVNGQIASSGSCVLPMMTQPAARSRTTSSSSAAAGSGDVAAEPALVGSPATSTLSLIATGTPASGRSPRSSRSATPPASATPLPAPPTWNPPLTR